jgi:hypothetical protein
VTGVSHRPNTSSIGSAWHWKQTDCWGYTPPGTKQRVPRRRVQFVWRLIDDKACETGWKVGKRSCYT